MRNSALVWSSLLLVACGSRTVQVAGDAAAPDGFGADLATRADGATPPADLEPFCSGTAKASLNGAALTLEQVTGEDYNSAAHAEGARVRLVGATSSGDRWEVNVQVMLGLRRTLVDEPLPTAVDIGPPAGLEADVFFMKPPGCASDPTCQSDLLATEYHRFSGRVTLDGEDYHSPLELRLCLSASDEGSRSAPDNLVHSVQVYLPAVTIPRWRLPWAP